MLVGAFITWLFVPETRLGKSRENQPLDELELVGNEAIFNGERWDFLRMRRNN